MVKVELGQEFAAGLIASFDAASLRLDENEREREEVRKFPRTNLNIWSIEVCVWRRCSH